MMPSKASNLKMGDHTVLLAHNSNLQTGQDFFNQYLMDTVNITQ